jgi:hypothetical protein
VFYQLFNLNLPPYFVYVNAVSTGTLLFLTHCLLERKLELGRLPPQVPVVDLFIGIPFPRRVLGIVDRCTRRARWSLKRDNVYVKNLTPYYQFILIDFSASKYRLSSFHRRNICLRLHHIGPTRTSPTNQNTTKLSKTPSID